MELENPREPESAIGADGATLRDATAVREFFNGCALYKRIVDNDYLCDGTREVGPHES